MNKIHFCDGKINPSFVFRQTVNNFLITKMNLVEKTLWNNIFAPEVAVLRKCMFIQERNPYFIQSSGTYKTYKTFTNTNEHFFWIDIYLRKYLIHIQFYVCIWAVYQLFFIFNVKFLVIIWEKKIQKLG